MPDEAGKPEQLNESSVQLLKRVLSITSVISSTPELASRIQQASSYSIPKQGDLRVIGKGSCGTVFEIPGTELAYKKGTIEDSIWRDYCYTNRVDSPKVRTLRFRSAETKDFLMLAPYLQDVQTVMRKAFPDNKIPQTPLCYEFSEAENDDFWSENLRRLPKEHRTKQPIFLVDRIPPLPQAAREALIDLYFDCNDTIQKEAKTSQDNKDCLIRVYLGERESLRVS